MITINGKDLAIAGRTLTDYLKENGYDLRLIAVERNGEIIPKTEYDTTILTDGDTLEIVSFVGGG